MSETAAVEACPLVAPFVTDPFVTFEESSFCKLGPGKDEEASPF